MDQYEAIRTMDRVYGLSVREISRKTGHHRSTVRKVLAGVEPKYRRVKERPCPVLGPVEKIMESWLAGDVGRPRKQRHTARRIHRRLVEEHGFQGSESTVRGWVRAWKARRGVGPVKAFVPLDPECAREAEVDWGEAQVYIGGLLVKVMLFLMRSRFSGLTFVKAYPSQRQEMFMDGHASAFAFFGGVFPTVVYDNLKTAVTKVLKGRSRLQSRRFRSLKAHYTFEARFCNPASGWEKGGVEGEVGRFRRNHMVPLPEVSDYAELNALLERGCLRAAERPISGRADDRTVRERHEAEKASLLALPGESFGSAWTCAVKVDRYQTVRLDRNRYSAPTELTGRSVWMHVSVEHVRLYARNRLVAMHRRSFSMGAWILDPQHYLGLIRRRPGAFEAARPIRQWRDQWPDSYETLLGALRSRLGESRGVREFVRVLQLHAGHPAEQVERAVQESMRIGAFGYAAVLQSLEAGKASGRDTPRPLAEGLLPGVTDRACDLSGVEVYDALLSGSAS